MYWVGIKITGVSLNDTAMGKLSMLHQQYMSCMTIPPLDLHRFIATDERVRMDVCEALGSPEGQLPVDPPKMPKTDTTYKSEHFELFQAYSMPWPAVLQNEYDGGFVIHTEGLTSRQVEVCIFCHKVFPPGDQRFGFMDVNNWLGMLVSYKNQDTEKLKSPWSDHPRTLVGSATMVVRVNDGHTKVVRPLEGWEYMLLVGWPVGAWQADVPLPPRGILSNLAGNAFSAFAMGATIASSLSVAGAVRGVADTCAAEPAATVAGSSDEDDSDDLT